MRIWGDDIIRVSSRDGGLDKVVYLLRFLRSCHHARSGVSRHRDIHQMGWSWQVNLWVCWGRIFSQQKAREGKYLKINQF